MFIKGRAAWVGLLPTICWQRITRLRESAQALLQISLRPCELATFLFEHIDDVQACFWARAPTAHWQCLLHVCRLKLQRIQEPDEALSWPDRWCLHRQLSHFYSHKQHFPARPKKDLKRNSSPPQHYSPDGLETRLNFPV